MCSKHKILVSDCAFMSLAAFACDQAVIPVPEKYINKFIYQIFEADIF